MDSPTRKIIIMGSGNIIYIGDISLNAASHGEKTPYNRRFTDIINNPHWTHKETKAVTCKEHIYITDFSIARHDGLQISKGKDLLMPIDKILLLYDIEPEKYVGDLKEKHYQRSLKREITFTRVILGFPNLKLEGDLQIDKILLQEKGKFFVIYRGQLEDSGSGPPIKRTLENLGPNKDGFYLVNRNMIEYIDLIDKSTG